MHLLVLAQTSELQQPILWKTTRLNKNMHLLSVLKVPCFETSQLLPKWLRFLLQKTDLSSPFIFCQQSLPQRNHLHCSQCNQRKSHPLHSRISIVIYSSHCLSLGHLRRAFQKTVGLDISVWRRITDEAWINPISHLLLSEYHLIVHDVEEFVVFVMSIHWLSSEN